MQSFTYFIIYAAILQLFSSKVKLPSAVTWGKGWMGGWCERAQREECPNLTGSACVWGRYSVESVNSEENVSTLKRVGVKVSLDENFSKHPKNCECCPLSLFFVTIMVMNSGSQLSEIHKPCHIFVVVLYLFVFVFVFVIAFCCLVGQVQSPQH